MILQPVALGFLGANVSPSLKTDPFIYWLDAVSEVMVRRSGESLGGMHRIKAPVSQYFYLQRHWPLLQKGWGLRPCQWAVFLNTEVWYGKSIQRLEFKRLWDKSLWWNSHRVLQVCWGNILADVEENYLSLVLTEKGAFESQVPNLDLGDPLQWWNLGTSRGEKHKFKQNLDK